MIKLFINAVITTAEELVPMVSTEVAASTALKVGVNYKFTNKPGKHYVDFNSISGVDAILILAPASIEDFFKIYQSLNLWVCNKEVKDDKVIYTEGRNKVHFVIKGNAYSTFTQMAAAYYKSLNNVIEFALPLKEGKYDWKTFRQRLNCINHTVVVRHKVGSYNWVKEAASYSKDSFYSKCSKDDYGAQYDESEYTDTVIHDDVILKIKCSKNQEKFLTQYYFKNKKWDKIPNITVRDTDMRHVEYKVISDYQNEVNSIFKMLFGPYDDDAITKTVIAYKLGSLVINKNTYELDRFHYDKNTFKDSINVLYNEIKTTGGNIDREIDELIDIMDDKGYFIEEDELLYEESTPDADFSDDWEDSEEIEDDIDDMEDEDEEVDESEDEFHLN